MVMNNDIYQPTHDLNENNPPKEDSFTASLKKHSLSEHVKENRARGDFPLKPEPYYVKYSIEIPIEDFDAITTYERNAGEVPLYDVLDKQTTASDIDYDVFFGSYITYGLERLDDTPEEHQNIVAIIEEFIKKAHEFKVE